MRKQKDSAGQDTSISAPCVGFGVWLRRGEFFKHQLTWAASQIIRISCICEMTSEACRSGGEARHPDEVCILKFAPISGFSILLDVKGTVDHPHQNRIPTQESCSHVDAMMEAVSCSISDFTLSHTHLSQHFLDNLSSYGIFGAEKPWLLMFIGAFIIACVCFSVQRTKRIGLWNSHP